MPGGRVKNFKIKDPQNPRDVALVAFLEVTENKRKSHLILREIFAEGMDPFISLSQRDRAFVKRLVIGSLRQLIAIDYILSDFTRKPFVSIRPIVKAILRLSAYQILYMDHVPDYAVLNEAVKLCCLHGFTGLCSFVNGLLRAFIVRQKDGYLPKLNTKSLEYSIPDWLCKKIKAQYGLADADLIFEGWSQERPLSIRLNISCISDDGSFPSPESETFRLHNGTSSGVHEDSFSLVCEGNIPGLKKDRVEQMVIKSFLRDGVDFSRINIDAIIGDYNLPVPKGRLPIMYELKKSGDIRALAAFKKGWISVEDPSGALVSSYADPDDGDFIMDICACPGAKSLGIADLMNQSGKVHARDISSAKTSLLDENIARCGFKNIKTRVWDALIIDEASVNKADIVIADLPCSGLGVIARKPDILLNLKPDDILNLQNFQRDILLTACKYVKLRGKLVYSTCTLSFEENEENVSWIQENLGFELLSVAKLLPGINHDGFFIATFRRIL